MKYTLTILAILFFYTNSFSQIHLDPIVGYSFSNLDDTNADNNFSASPTIGIGFSGNIQEKVSLETIAVYSKHTYLLSTNTIFGNTSFIYNKVSLSFVPNFHLFKNFSLGIGSAYNRLFNVEFDYSQNLTPADPIRRIGEENQIAMLLSCQYYFKSIILRLRHVREYSILTQNSTIERTNSFELLLAYRFKNIIKNKKSHTPNLNN